MTQLSLTTTQNVTIDFEMASLGDRILAFVIDSVIKVLYVVVVIFCFNLFQFNDWFSEMDNWSRLSVALIFGLPFLFYSLFFESVMQGTTPGKRVMKIKVVKIEGYQAQLGDFFVRWIFRLVDIAMSLGALGVISIVMSNKNQRLGDLLAGTAVLSMRKRIDLSHTIFREIKVDYIPTYPQVMRLSDSDIQIVKEAFANARKNRDWQLLEQLTSKIESTIGIINQSESQMEFVEKILSDYNYYTVSM